MGGWESGGWRLGEMQQIQVYIPKVHSTSVFQLLSEKIKIQNDNKLKSHCIFIFGDTTDIVSL